MMMGGAGHDQYNGQTAGGGYGDMNANGGGAGNYNQYDLSQAQQFQPQAPDMSNVGGPAKARKMAAAKPAEDEDEGWGDAGALLD